MIGQISLNTRNQKNKNNKINPVCQGTVCACACVLGHDLKTQPSSWKSAFTPRLCRFSKLAPVRVQLYVRTRHSRLIELCQSFSKHLWISISPAFPFLGVLVSLLFASALNYLPREMQHWDSCLYLFSTNTSPGGILFTLGQFCVSLTIAF